MTADDAQQRSIRQKGIRRSALILTVLALAFYLGFILVGVLNA